MPNDADLLTEPGVSVVAIEVDPEVPGSILQGRCDWLIRGRFVSDEPAEEVMLMLAGVPVARMGYGRSGAHTRRNADGQCVAVFHLHLSRPLALAGAPCGFDAVASTQSGQTVSTEFTLSPVQGQQGVGLITRGATHRMTGPDTPRPPIVLYVENAARDPSGRVIVHGWSVAFSPMLEVQVLAGDKPLASAPIAQLREDVASVLPMYPNAARSGFVAFAAGGLPEHAETVTIRAITRDGFMHELTRALQRVPAVAPPPAPARPAATAAAANMPERRKINYHWDEARLDETGGLLIEGWAVCAAGIMNVGLELEDKPLGAAELGGPRPDVGAQFPEIPLARVAGFRLHRKAPEAAAAIGTQRMLRLTIRNGLDDLVREDRIIEVTPAVNEVASSSSGGGEEGDSFKLEIDSPSIIAGAVPGTISGRLVIEGWALARTGVEAIDVLLDDAKLGEAHVGLARQDVGNAHPDWEGSLRSGYAFHCPPRALPEGAHTVSLLVRARDGSTLTRSFAITVSKTGNELQAALRRRMSRAESDIAEAVLDRHRMRPVVQLVLPVPAGTGKPALAATLASLDVQAYADWRLLLLPADSSARAACRAVMESFPGCGTRTKVEKLARAKILHDAGLLAVLAPGDELGCDALLEAALERVLHPDSDFLYADDIRETPGASGREAFFKPAFSPDLLLSMNYVGRTWFATPDLLARAGLDLPALAAFRTYDAVLRLAEQARGITRIPKLLASLAPAPAAEDERASLQDAARRRGIDAEVLPGAGPNAWRFRRSTAGEQGLVSIIIPTCAAHGYIKTCIEGLRTKTAYRNIEIVCIENIPDSLADWRSWLRENADTVVTGTQAFNWSLFNNLAVRASRGEFLLFLNDDVEVIEPDWLDALLEHARRPEVGIVGARLLYPDGKIQHAGMFLAEPGIGRHAFRFAARDEAGYFGLAQAQRNVTALTGACMLVRRTDFDALGGFDETHDVVNNDLDYCLRVHESGKLAVFTPYATLIHHELASRENLPESYDRSHFQSRWNAVFAAGDPYFSPRLTRHADDVRPDEEPVEAVVAGPLFHASDIRRILVVKLDHIGDLITALPPIRRLKRHFPNASITLLGSPASRTLAEAEPTIDEVIPFQFFNTRSELGRMEISEETLADLRARLTARRFDLGIDLRKLGDTRYILELSGARYLAGFDHLGEFSYLDIALEWEADRALQPKRRHVAGDLIALVDSVASAADDLQKGFLLSPIPDASDLDFLPEDVRPLFEKPVVIIHPAAGAVNKQWAPENFAVMIDLLAARHDANAILIGGPDDAPLEQTLLGAVMDRSRVGSVVGRLPLRELPRLFAAASLYIGNDSGPKHIAVASGLPTLGIHSGTVDATEWAPLGPAGIALRRAMTCSPCYIAKAEDCPRNLACLRELEPDSVLPYAETLLALRARPAKAKAPPSAPPQEPALAAPPQSPAPGRQKSRGRTRR